VAFSDPQTITINAIANSLLRIFSGTSVGSFKTADGNLELTLDPRGTARRRRNVARTYQKKSYTDPSTGFVSLQGTMVSLTIDRPLAGFTDAEVELLASGFITWLTASTNANLKKVIAGEN
jgi:hypothetical protein